AAGGPDRRDDADGDEALHAGRRAQTAPSRGTAPDDGCRGCSGLPLWASRSTRTNSSGMRKTAIIVAANMPVMTTVPRMRRAAAPEPVATHSGTQPRMKANDVIRMGR